MGSIFSCCRKKPSTSPSIDAHLFYLVVGKNGLKFVERCIETSTVKKITNDAILPMSYIKTEFLTENSTMVINFLPYISNDLRNISSSGALRGKDVLIFTLDANDFATLKLIEDYIDFIKKMSMGSMQIVMAIIYDGPVDVESDFFEKVRQFTNKLEIARYAVDMSTGDGLRKLFAETLPPSVSPRNGMAK